MTDRQITHAPGCCGWGPAHYDCAVREIERLREQLRLATVDQAIAEAEMSDAHAENKRLREALEVMVEMVEMNGFGRDYAIDVARAALGRGGLREVTS